MATLGSLYKSSVLTVSVIMALIPLALGKLDLLGMAVIALGSIAVFDLFGKDYGYYISPLLSLLYLLMYYGLIGMTQFVVVAGALISLVVAKDVEKLKFVGSPEATLLYPLRMLGMAVLAVLGPFYLLYTAIRYGGLIYKVTAVLAAGLAVMSLGMSITPLYMGYLDKAFSIDLTSPITWVGLVGYEELISRPFGVVGNAFWALLHFPSRYYYTGLASLYAVLIVANGGRWLYETYKRGGIVASIIGHAVYNAYIYVIASSSLFTLPIVLMVGAFAYFIFKNLGKE